MRIERVERRVLGAISFRDAATNLRILNSLRIEAESVRFVRNRSNCYVITAAPNFQAYVDSFAAQPIAPDPQSIVTESVAVEIKVSDPRGNYLPRRSTIRLPLDPATAKPESGGWLFESIDVPLFPAPASGTVPGWAIIRATIREEGTTDRLPWALIKVRRAGNSQLIAVGLADERGEALVPVPGIPVTASDTGTGAVLTSEIEVSLEAIFDTRVRKIRDPEDLDATLHQSREYIPNPSELEGGGPPNFKSNTSTTRLASGREHRAELSVNLA